VLNGTWYGTALDGRFDDHHAELARMLGRIDALSTQIDTLTMRIEELIAELPEQVGAVDEGGPGADPGAVIDADPDAASAVPTAATPILSPTAAVRVESVPLRGPIARPASSSASMTAAHLVSWAKLSPRTIQSGLGDTRRQDR
jgi:transposase